VWRIAVLNSLAEGDPEAMIRLVVFEQAMKELGWTNGGNLRIEYRWAGNDPELIRKFATELVALAPDVIMTSGSVVVGPRFGLDQKDGARVCANSGVPRCNVALVI
jgi:putative ABC transport system substrate-binding protein